MEDSFAEKALLWDNPKKIEMTTNFVQEIEKLGVKLSMIKIVEVGTGTGLVGLQLATNASEMLLIDTSPAMLKILENKLLIYPQPHVRYQQATMEMLTENDFDLVVSFMTWHHIADTDSAFDSASKLLNTGGKLVIGDLLSEDGSFHGGDDVPHCGFDMEVLRVKAEVHGLAVRELYQFSAIEKQTSEGNTKSYGQFILYAEKM
jgi:ubiquinone/menaquinone biosynthesis C-methylase UbiE